MNQTLRIELPTKLAELFSGEARYRCAYGGRGSGKTRSFAKMAAVKALQLALEGKDGIILCGREFQNSLDESSLQEVKAAIASEPMLAGGFDVGEKFVRTRPEYPGRIEFKFAGLRHNIDSIKSKSQIHILWVDEAEPVSEEAWVKIVPTVREHNSEIWVSWNPELKTSATHKRFRLNPPDHSKVVEINWQDNPWFPDVLNKERLSDKKNRPEQYLHIWGGDFITVFEGAYFASQIVEAREDGRIGKVGPDPLMRLRAFWDLGGRGLKSDATVIWIAQFVGREIRVLDYYEAVGQTVGAHVSWLREKKYDKALCVLPHDGEPMSPIADASWQTALESAGFEVEIVPNQGTGAAMTRVEVARRMFPSVWFNEEPCSPGIDWLGQYRSKKNENGMDVGPLHDSSSHAADAFGMMCQVWEPPSGTDMPEDYEVDDTWVV